MKITFSSLTKSLSAFALGATVVLGGAALAFSQKPKADRFDPPPLDERPIARDAGSHTSFAPVVKKVAPAVVKVFTTTKAHNMAYSGPPEMDDLFRHFFGDQFGGRSQRRAYSPPQTGIGSGVIATKDGYILTNNHVVDGADEVQVALQDGREFTAKVIGRDPKSDVAVIKIEAKDLPALQMADSEKVEVGDVVLAIGNPFGIGQTVTSGIVSATGRSGAVNLDYEDFIQTDAAINPGNSGGALVDAEGRLIGINTAILSRTGGNQGIGFAIPANLARDVMEGLVKDGHVTRGQLGVYLKNITPALAKKFDLKDTNGALVAEVEPGSPADKAGIKGGDILVEFNGKKVTDSHHLKFEVARTHPGESVAVKVLRDGSSKSMEVAIGNSDGTEHLAKAEKSTKDDNGTLNGVTVADLDRQTRQEFEVPPTVKGVVISDVSPDSAAAGAGLRRGDVILEINRKPVKTADEAVRLTENTTDKTTLLRVWRAGHFDFVVVDESKAG
jgi:serine protease Do